MTTQPLVFVAISLLIGSLLPISKLNAQVIHSQPEPHISTSSAIARQRMASSIARQQAALSAMKTSVASQKRAIERQHPAVLIPGAVLTPVPFADEMPELPQCDRLPRREIDSLVNTAAERNSLSPDLIRSVMRQESDFRACAVSSKGAIGLMQLIPSTASSLGVKDIFDPEANVMGGARLLRQLLDHYSGDLKLTLSAYNAGAGRVDAASGVPMIPETINYVSRILSSLTPGNSTRADAAEGSENKALTAENQYNLNSASDTSFWLIGNDAGE